MGARDRLLIVTVLGPPPPPSPLSVILSKNAGPQRRSHVPAPLHAAVPPQITHSASLSPSSLLHSSREPRLPHKVVRLL